MSDYEKKKISDCIKKNYNIKDSRELKNVYIYIKILIFYFIKNSCNEDDEIINTIKNIKEYRFINDYNFLNICKSNGINLKIKKLMNVFLFLEELCFNLYKNTIKSEYSKELKESVKDKIINNLINDENNKIYINQISKSVERFISRYLIMNNKDDIYPDSKLIIQLKKRVYLWDEDMRNIQNIEKNLELIKDFDITIGQALKFYELIKEKETISH